MLLGRDQCLNEGEGGRGHAGIELPWPSLRQRSHGEIQLWSHPWGKGRLEKLRATGFFTSAANPLSSPALGPSEEVEISLWPPNLQGMNTGQAGPPHSAVHPAWQGTVSLLSFVPTPFSCYKKKGSTEKDLRKLPNSSSRKASQSWSLQDTQCRLGKQPTLPRIRARGRRPPVPALSYLHFFIFEVSFQTSTPQIISFLIR